MKKVFIRQALTVAIALLTANIATVSPTFAHQSEDAAPLTSNNLRQSNRAEKLANRLLTKDNDSALITIPGTSVSLIPPADFVLSEQFSGFKNPETFSSIVLTELPPEAYSDIAETFSSTPEEISITFASQGISLEVKNVSTLTVGDVQVPFVEGIQTVSGTQVKKFFALIEGENTILLTFNIIDATQIERETIVETVQSVDVRSAPTIQQKVEELPFTFSAADPFEIFEVLAGSSVILSINGETDPSGETPLVIIASSVSPVQTADLTNFDLANFSAQLLQNTEGFNNSTITDQSPTAFAGAEGYFTQASLGNETILQYLTILPDNFYIRMVVISQSEQLDALMPAIQTIQSSVASRE